MLNSFFYYISIGKSAIAAECGGVSTAVISCDGNGIFGLINVAITWLTSLFFIAAVLLIVISGIQLTTSGGNPKAIETAKKRITSVVISIIALMSIRILAEIFLPGGSGAVFN